MNQKFSSWFGDDPLTQFGGNIREYGGLGLNSNMQLLCYFSDKKKIINLGIFAEKFSSLDLQMQQDFFDIFLKSFNNNKTNEIDFLYFLCSAQFNSKITINEYTILNLLNNIFCMRYDLKMFSNSLFLDKIYSYFVSLLDNLRNNKKDYYKAKIKLEIFLDLFFNFSEECPEYSSEEYTKYSDAKVDFFIKIYNMLSVDSKDYIQSCMKPEDILRLKVDSSMISIIKDRKEEDSFSDLGFLEIKHREEEDPFSEFFDVDTIGSERRVGLKVFEKVLAPLEWSEERLNKWLK